MSSENNTNNEVSANHTIRPTLWKTSTVVTMVMIVGAITNLATFFITTYGSKDDLLVAERDYRHSLELKEAQHQSQIDILTNQHGRELRDLGVKLGDLELDVTDISNKLSLHQLLNHEHIENKQRAIIERLEILESKASGVPLEVTLPPHSH